MDDLFAIVGGVTFFVITAGIVALCEHLAATPSEHKR